jgi:N-acetylneuraminate synthase
MSPQNPTSVFTIAEVGSVHDGSFGNAQRLIDLAARCGADAVKFQTHIATAESLPGAPAPTFFQTEPRLGYFERTAFKLEQWQELKARCDRASIAFLSSPFSCEAVDILETVGVDRYKLPSGEVTNLPLLDAIAQTGKPVLLSSGMSSWSELDTAVSRLLPAHGRVTVLQCTSEYPCPHEVVGLNVMLEIRERYGLPVGLSDHTLDPYASLAAVALGASVIEKHLTFSRAMYGSDAVHSLEPAEFAEMTRGIRSITTMLASPVDKDAAALRLGGMKAIFEKSIVSLVDIPGGTVITAEMVGLKKPGTGLPAARMDDVIGSKALHNISKDSIILEEYLERA